MAKHYHPVEGIINNNLKLQNFYLFNYIYYVLWLELTGADVGGNEPNIRFDFGDQTSIIISIL